MANDLDTRPLERRRQKTDEEYNALLNARDSKEAFILIDRRMNDLSADAGMLRKFVESLHIEVRDVRTQTITTQKWVEENATVTREVRDILGSFSFIGSVAKWLTTVAAALAIVWAITKGWFKT